MIGSPAAPLAVILGPTASGKSALAVAVGPTFRRRSRQTHQCLMTALIVMAVLLVPRQVVAAEDGTVISIQCEPTALVFGSATLSTWTLSSTQPSGALVDVVLTQDHIDQMSPSWWQMEPTPAQVTKLFDTESVINDVRMSNSRVPSRSSHLADDDVLAFPIEVIQPGGRFLANGRREYPGAYQVTWALGWGISTSAITLTFATGPGTLAMSKVMPERPHSVPLSSALDASFRPAVVRAGDDLIATVKRISADCDRPEIWRSAVLEWTRLPERSGALTTVYSPIQAGTAVMEERTKEAVPPSSPGQEIRFSVTKAMSDPRTGKLLPGMYRIRLAMAWDDTVVSSNATQAPIHTRYRIHSRAQTVRVLAPGEAAPERCPFCDAPRNDQIAPPLNQP